MLGHLTDIQYLKKEYQSVNVDNPLNTKLIYVVFSDSVYFSPHGAVAPSGLGPPHYRGFPITFRNTILGRAPLDEWSARRRTLYLTTHNTYKGQTWCPPHDSNPQSQEASGRRLILSVRTSQKSLCTWLRSLFTVRIAWTDENKWRGQNLKLFVVEPDVMCWLTQGFINFLK
jgi:hypothetical protein